MDQTWFFISMLFILDGCLVLYHWELYSAAESFGSVCKKIDSLLHSLDPKQTFSKKAKLSYPTGKSPIFYYA